VVVITTTIILYQNETFNIMSSSGGDSSSGTSSNTGLPRVFPAQSVQISSSRQQLQEHLQSSSTIDLAEDDNDVNNNSEKNYSVDHEILLRKEQAIDNLLNSVDSIGWRFQSQVDKKARDHMRNILLDYWPRDKKNKKAAKKKANKKDNNNGSQDPVISDEELNKELEISLTKCHEEMLFEYEKWTQVAQQKYLIGKKKEEIITALLLLLMVFGEIDLIRTQNHTLLLLFHTALRCMLAEQKNGGGGQQSSNPQDIQEEVEEAAEEGEHEEKDEIELHEEEQQQQQPDQSQNKEGDSTTGADKEQEKPKKAYKYKTSKINSIASLVNYEAKWVYRLMSVVFDKNLRNEQFFDWDDLNDLSWTPGFVKNFLSKPKGKDTKNDKLQQPPAPVCSNPIYEVAGFEHAFKMRSKFNMMNRAIHGIKYSGEDEEKEFKNEKTKFAKLWKTYFDSAGGWFGWRGYLTYFINFYPPVYYQLICLTVALAWMFDFGMDKTKSPYAMYVGPLNLVHIIVAAVPVGIAGFYFVVSVLLSWRTQPSLFHPHRFTIPRRDKLMHKSEFRFARADFLNIIPGYIRSLFHLHHIASLIMFFLLTALYIVTLRYVIFESSREITIDIISLTLQLVKGPPKMSGKEYANVALVYVSFALLWVSLLFVFVILPPILLSVCAGVMGFVKGFLTGVSRVNCWTDVKRCLQDKNLILRNFRKKMLADHSPMKECDRELTEVAWATVWNAIIEEFYDNHQCSKAEKNRFSYKLKLFDNSQLKIVQAPDLSMRPAGKDMRRQLIRFVNNLYMRSMPYEGVRIMDMKRLVVFTPVFREKVFYTWEELVQPNNTSNSFLRALIIKYPIEWKNFKEKEFPEGNRLRKTVDYIEAKVLAGIDITQHVSQKVTTTQFMKKMIQSWASQRFQPVSRTVKGFMRIPKAISILLRLQNPELSDEQVRKIVRQKFSYIVGAQLYDESMWKAATGYDKLSDESARKENLQEHLEYVQGLDYLCKTIGDSMLKVAFMKREVTQSGEEKFTSVLRVYDGESPRNLYEVTAYGDFSKVGQGKPTNQGHMLQFFDGSFCQAVDCNMDAALSQCFFIPNVLKEFDKDKKVKIVGFPEDVITKDWSYAGYAAAFTERVFGSIIQRVWNMMNLRFHYGHPDFLRGMFVMFTTSLSKLSYISEDVFNGFDMMLNGGKSIHVEYLEVGKARDVCMISTTKFNRKTAGGAAQIACSRYPYAILTSRHFTLLDKLMFCYSVISHYSNTLLTILAAFVLYSTRVGILIAVLITVKYTNVTSTLDLFSTVELISGNLSLATDSLFLFQMGMALSIPGILQNILDRGLLRGIYEYLMSLVFLLMYSMFQLMNTCFYFHYGMNQSAKYIASGRVTGLQHTSITEIFRTFKDTHFYPSGIMLILQIIGISTGGSPLFLLFHSVLIFIWVFSPFLFNEGSIPMSTPKMTWQKLYAEDNYKVKWWIRNDCHVEDVDKLILKANVDRSTKIEYQYSAGQMNAEDLELDLELNLMERRGIGQEKNYFDRDHSDRQYSLVHMQNQMQRKRTLQPTSDDSDKKKKEKPAKKEKKSKEEKKKEKKERKSKKDKKAEKEKAAEPINLDTILDPDQIEHKKLMKFGKRRRLLHFYLKQPLLILKFLLKLIPKLYLLLILYGTKLLAYGYVIYKMIAPWTSPPGYEDAYRKDYEEKILESRIMNIQRVFWFMKKDMSNFMEVSKQKTVNRVMSVSSPTGNQGKELIGYKKDSSSSSFHHKPLSDTQQRKLLDSMDRLNLNDFSRLRETIKSIDKVFAKNGSHAEMKKAYDKLQNQLQERLSQLNGTGMSMQEFIDLASKCSDYAFLNMDPNQKIVRKSSMICASPSVEDSRRNELIMSFAQWDLFPHYERFAQKVDKAISAVDAAVSKSTSYERISRATIELIEAGCFIIMDNRREFEKLLFTHDPSLNNMRERTRILLVRLIGKSVYIAEKYMLHAKRDYENFSIKLHQKQLFDSATSNKTNRQRSIVRSQLELSLNYAKRLTEGKTSKRHKLVDQFNSKLLEPQLLTCDAFEGDNGTSIFAQMFPIFSEGEVVGLTESRRNEIQTDKIELLDALSTEMKDRLIAKPFLELESNCLDMLEFLDKSNDDNSNNNNNTGSSNDIDSETSNPDKATL